MNPPPPPPVIRALASMVTIHKNKTTTGRPCTNRLRNTLAAAIPEDVFLNIDLFDNALHTINEIFRNCDWIDDELRLTKVNEEDACRFFEEDGQDYPVFFVLTNLTGEVTDAAFYHAMNRKKNLVFLAWRKKKEESSNNMYIYRTVHV